MTRVLPIAGLLLAALLSGCASSVHRVWITVEEGSPIGAAPSPTLGDGIPRCVIRWDGSGGYRQFGELVNACRRMR